MKHTFCCIIKGTLPEATLRALRDDLRIREVRESEGNVTGLIETTHEVMSRWFCEQPHEPPFPPGTLLHYRVRIEPEPRVCRHCGAVVQPRTLVDIGGRPEFEVCPKCSRTYEGYLVL